MYFTYQNKIKEQKQKLQSIQKRLNKANIELNNKSKLIQKKIALKLTSKFTPKLKFFFDSSFEYSDKINNILETINR